MWQAKKAKQAPLKEKTPKTKLSPLENHWAANQRAAAFYEGVDAHPIETMLAETTNTQWSELR